MSQPDQLVSTARTRAGEVVRAAHELAYRPDIDGLRAVAVLSVVGFHAFPRRLTGGFVGVDIFFVISGYLISGLIYKALREGHFSYRQFYARRVRRIFPALLTVLLATLAAGALWLFPSEYKEVGRQAVAGAGFLANILFWSESGYFDAAAQSKPLLHLWSLGIEEQFYIVWPLVLAFLYSRTAKMAWIIGGIATLSLVCNLVTVGSNPVAAFYSPLTRFWELLLGALLAYAAAVRARSGDSSARTASDGSGLEGQARWITESVSWTGLVLVAGSLVLLDESQPFPGWRALPPTLGAACLLASRTAWLNRKLLAGRIPVFIGVISYPLYLWHWVMFTTFQRAPLLQSLQVGRLPLVVLSGVLAWLTYELIEKPIRFGKSAAKNTPRLVVACAVAAAVGLLVNLTEGAAFRYPPAVRPFASFEYDPDSDYRGDVCEIDPDAVRPPFQIDPRCIDSPRPGAQLLVLWGDSHAASLYQGLEALRRGGLPIQVAQVTAGACPPLLGARLGKRSHCLEYTEQMLAQIERLKPEIVVLAGAWTGYAERARTPQDELIALQQMVKRLQSAGVPRVIVFGCLPVWTIAQPNVVLRVWQETHRVPSRTYSYFDPVSAQVDTEIAAALSGSGAVFVSPIKSLCNAEGCLLRADTAEAVPVTWDTNHLTREGSTLLVKLNEAAVLGGLASGAR